jgi:hypothetical protein
VEHLSITETAQALGLSEANVRIPGHADQDSDVMPIKIPG